MKAAYLVMYRGEPEDPEAFLDYYLHRHVPLVWEFPGIRDVQLLLGRDGGEHFLITRLLFDDLEALRAAITSPQRARARADMKGFPAFRGTVHWQVVEVMDTRPS